MVLDSFRVAVDVFEVVIGGCRWLQVVVGGCRWFYVVLGCFGSFHVLVLTRLMNLMRISESFLYKAQSEVYKIKLV